MAEINSSYLSFKTRIRDAFLQGVYNDTYEFLTDGGPKCASESTLGFKYVLNILIVRIKVSLRIFYFENLVGLSMVLCI